MAENAGPTAIGIAAPTDLAYLTAALTITAATLPADGIVILAHGVTPITAGQALTAAQLAGPTFTPTLGQFATSSAFTHKVADPAGNAATGTATLAIGPSFGDTFINTAANSTITNSMPNAEGIKEWTHHDLFTAPAVTNDGPSVTSAALDGQGDVAEYSTSDGLGHALSASGTGQSIIAAGSGNDTVTLANGADLLATGAGADTVNLQSGQNQVRSEGNDAINVGTGLDQIEVGGAAGHNLLVAGTAATTLYTGGDGDVLVANGGASHADIVAALGTDLFNFTKGNANTTYIAGFKVGTDTVHLSGFAAHEASQALANASIYQGSEILAPRDGSNITFGNVTGLTRSSFV